MDLACGFGVGPRRIPLENWEGFGADLACGFGLDGFQGLFYDTVRELG